MGTNETNFILVELKPNYDPDQVSNEISKISGASAFITSKIRKNTRNFMTFESGMGIGVGTMVLIGMFVAAVIISLTIYTATMERIPEFGTLKAIGASKKDIYRILLEQVFVSVTLGYIIGVICSFAVATMITRVTLMPVKITQVTLVIAYFSTLILSVLGSFSSIRRVNKIDPAIVFRA